MTAFERMSVVALFLEIEMRCTVMTFGVIIGATLGCKNDLLPCVGFQNTSRGGGGYRHAQRHSGHLDFMSELHDTLLTQLRIKYRMKPIRQISTNR